jgi:hypothetical protein
MSKNPLILRDILKLFGSRMLNISKHRSDGNKKIDLNETGWAEVEWPRVGFNSGLM